MVTRRMTSLFRVCEEFRELLFRFSFELLLHLCREGAELTEFPLNLVSLFDEQTTSGAMLLDSASFILELTRTLVFKLREQLVEQ